MVVADAIWIFRQKWAGLGWAGMALLEPVRYAEPTSGGRGGVPHQQSELTYARSASVCIPPGCTF